MSGRGVGAGSGASGKTFGQLEREVAELKRLVKELIQPKSRARVVNVGSGASGRFYKLIEDSHPTNGLIQKYAVRVGSPAGEAPETTPSLVVPWLLAPVLAGHIGWYMQYDSKWYFIQGDCPTECPNDGVLTVGSPPTGTVDEAYSHAVSGSGLTGGDYSSVDFTGLPPGLTHDEEEISGTPTEAGTFYVVVTATAPNSDDEDLTCTLTRVLRIVIEEAEEEE
jgi:hypothetical protein